MEDYLPVQEEGIVYEIAKDPARRQAYFSLRELCYREDLEIKGFSGAEDPYYDKEGVILIALSGGEVIAGARLFVARGDLNQLLPLEDDDFRLSLLLPELQLQQKIYCSISRLVVHRAYRHRKIYEKIAEICLDIAKKQGARFEFSVVTMLQARSNRRVYSHLGYPMVVMRHIKVPYLPEYEGLNAKGIVLSVAYFYEEDFAMHQKFLFAVEETSTEVL